MKHLSLVLSLAVVCLVSTATGYAQDKQADTVTEMVKKGFNTFVAALSKTDYLGKVASGTYTVLAPTDVAFRDKPKVELDALLADKEKLTAMIANHLVEGKISSADLKSGEVKTVGGTAIQAKVVDGKLKIGTATVVKQDVPAKNGVIHGIDAFLESK
jgi:uncharacterized surface protein with fasciclin (FAS1) repeats